MNADTSGKTAKSSTRTSSGTGTSIVVTDGGADIPESFGLRFSGDFASFSCNSINDKIACLEWLQLLLAFPPFVFFPIL